MNYSPSNYFETRERLNGDRFVCLTDDAPEWLTDAVRKAHDGEFPNDWRYRICSAICDELDAETDDDRISDIADSLVDVYNYELITWAGEHVNRIGDVDEACREYGVADDAGIIDRISLGQYVTIRNMAETLAAAYYEARTA